MKLSDYLNTFTSAILTADKDRSFSLLDHLQKRYETRMLRKPHLVSLGGRGAEGEEQNFHQWISGLMNEGVEQVSFHWLGDPDSSLAPHLAAAFAGSGEPFLRVRTGKATRVYYLRTVFSPAHEMTFPQLKALIDALPQSNILWDRVIELINEGNQLNGRPVVSKENLAGYMESPEGKDVFEFHCANILSEVQVECDVHDIPFSVPEELSMLLYKPEFYFPEIESHSVYLYPLREVTGKELLDLVNAQPFADRIWSRCGKAFSEHPLPDIPAMQAEQWPSFIEHYSGDATSLAHAVCNIICSYCESRDLKRIIPAHLKDAFGPGELEEKRIHARSKSDRWGLQPNSRPWQMYFYEETGITDMPAVTAPEKASVKLRASLAEIAAFATDIQSPFAEAFLLAEYLLSKDVPEGILDQQHRSLIEKDLRKNGFSEMAIENFNKAFQYTEDFSEFGWSPGKISGLLAVSLADVFGGMGSWNDVYLEEAQETHQKLSAKVFLHLKQYQTALLSSDGKN